MYMSGRKLNSWFQPLPRKPGHMANLIPTQKCPMPRARAWVLCWTKISCNFFCWYDRCSYHSNPLGLPKNINLNKGFFCTNFLDEFEQWDCFSYNSTETLRGLRGSIDLWEVKTRQNLWRTRRGFWWTSPRKHRQTPGKKNTTNQFNIA